MTPATNSTASGNSRSSCSVTRPNWAAANSAFGWAKIVRTRVATTPWALLGTRVSTLWMKWVTGNQTRLPSLGVNIGVAAPMAFFPFTGWKNSFFGDLHATGAEGVQFYTWHKVVTSRWWLAPKLDHSLPEGRGHYIAAVTPRGGGSPPRTHGSVARSH